MRDRRIMMELLESSQEEAAAVDIPDELQIVKPFTARPVPKHVKEPVFQAMVDEHPNRFGNTYSVKETFYTWCDTSQV